MYSSLINLSVTLDPIVTMNCNYNNNQKEFISFNNKNTYLKIFLTCEIIQHF
jgi:hypothetical protein